MAELKDKELQNFQELIEERMEMRKEFTKLQSSLDKAVKALRLILNLQQEDKLDSVRFAEAILIASLCLKEV